AAALKAAESKGQLLRGPRPITAAAPRMQISRNPPRSPVSVITIPADAPPGMYDLLTGISSGGGTVTGPSIVPRAERGPGDPARCARPLVARQPIRAAGCHNAQPPCSPRARR